MEVLTVGAGDEHPGRLERSSPCACRPFAERSRPGVGRL